MKQFFSDDSAFGGLFSKDSVFLEEDADSSFGTVYLILVFAIAALLLVMVVKPMFQQAQKTIPKSK
jgi:hypothetical protein